jgi:hypothetical protein
MIMCINTIVFAAIIAIAFGVGMLLGMWVFYEREV